MERIKKIVLACMLIVNIPVFAFAGTKGNTKASNNFDWNPVMEAIIIVESGGNAKAKSGNSVGAMQITPILVKECNRILKSRNSKKRYTLSDRFSIKKSKEMFLIFQSAYNQNNSVEYAIRSWNGGPKYTKKHTEHYFQKVMKHLKK